MLEISKENSGKNEIELNENTSLSIDNQHINDFNVANFETASAPDDLENLPDKELDFVDFTEFSLEELVHSLKKMLENNPIQQLKTPVDSIKIAFNKKFETLVADKKQAFLDEGGNLVDFQFFHPSKTEFGKLLAEYKSKRDAHYANIDKNLNENLEKRLLVIEELKKLIDEAKPSTMYKNFREIQEKWNAIGVVPKSNYNDTWKTYQHHVERFYDLLHLSNDFRESDFKHNLDEKLKIIEKAVALANEKDVNFAAKQLQELHKIWKEDIGPVSKEVREEIWQKFSDATKTIHDKRHEYFKEIQFKYDELIKKKLLVVEEIYALDVSKNKSHSDWQKSMNELDVLRKKYFDIGKLPYAKSEEIWQKFKIATNNFNNAKNIFYKNEKAEQQQNLQKKIGLIEMAESLKESDDWEMATNAMKKIQADWKKIGHIPRKFSDDIWKRFKDACDFYFNRLHQQKNAITKEQQHIVDKKTEFLDTLKSKKKFKKEEVFNAMNNWQDLGKLPKNSRHLEGKFNKLIDTTLDTLSLDKNEVNFLKFKNTVDSLLENNDFKKLDAEQLFVRKKIDEITREIQQLENNLSFFSISNKNNPLVLNVQNQVSENKVELALWKEKLVYLKKLDY